MADPYAWTMVIPVLLFLLVGGNHYLAFFWLFVAVSAYFRLHFLSYWIFLHQIIALQLSTYIAITCYLVTINKEWDVFLAKLRLVTIFIRKPSIVLSLVQRNSTKYHIFIN